MKLATVVGLAGVAAAARVAPAQEPTGPCDLYFENPVTTHSTSVRLPSGKYNSYIGGGVIGHCRGQSNTLTADSAEFYDEKDLLYLIGRVHYVEPRIKVDSDRMTYYVGEGRLIAEGHVFAVLPSGTTMRGPWAEYLRVLPGVRTVAQLTATGRPHLHLVQRDTTNKAPRADSATVDTAGIDADRVLTVGDSLIYASGRVVVLRTDVKATSDSAAMDNGQGFARLLRTPMIEGTQSKHPFTLRGAIIDLYSANHELQRVVSKQNASAVSQDLHLTSDTIDLRLTARQLSRAYAWGPSRAHATTPERDILADSLDVLMPQQRVQEVRSIRKAYATSIPDTVHIKSTERDWMKGDTILAQFDTTPPPAKVTAATKPAGSASSAADARRAGRPAPDTSAEPAIKTLLARGNARALYQLPPKDKKSPKPALNYVRGRIITIAFADRQVHTVTVVDSAAGVYLEPAIDSAATDSARAAHRASVDSAHAAARRAKALKHRP